MGRPKMKVAIEPHFSEDLPKFFACEHCTLSTEPTYYQVVFSGSKYNPNTTRCIVKRMRKFENGSIQFYAIDPTAPTIVLVQKKFTTIVDDFRVNDDGTITEVEKEVVEKFWCKPFENPKLSPLQWNPMDSVITADIAF